MSTSGLAASPADSAPAPQADRQRWMGVLARGPAAALRQHLADLPPLPPHARVRGPETGLVMVRGRQGGDGAPFNLGEMTVTRCTVRLPDDVLGHAYIAGRDAGHAELAAVLDGALQLPAWRAVLLAAVIGPMAAVQAESRTRLARKAAATRVAFATLATMR